MSRSSLLAPRSSLFSPRSSLLALLPTLLALLLCLLAFALRIHALDGQSMWNDEGLSLHRSTLPLATIASNRITVDGFDTTDTNPPFYFLLLHLWRTAVANNIFALRFLGAIFGLLSIPLIYGLGRFAFNRWVGLVAAALLTLSPFHIWQSQEMRNYSLLITLNLLSTYALLRFLLAKTAHGSLPTAHHSQRRWQWLAICLTAALLGVYTHYFGFFILAYTLLTLTGYTLWHRNLKFLSPSFSASSAPSAVKSFSPVVWVVLALAVLLLLPILPIALGRFQAGQQSGFGSVPPLHILSHALSAYSVGFRPTVVQPWWRVAPVVLLAAAGLITGLASGRPRRQQATFLLLAYLIVPLTILLALSTINPLYNGPRHLLIGLPPFLLLAAAPVQRFSKSFLSSSPHKERFAKSLYPLLCTTLLLFTLFSQAAWLHVQFTSPALIKDDLRSAAEWISQAAAPNDVVVLHDALIRFTFEPYYTGTAPLLTIPAFASGDEQAAISALETAGRTAGRVWFVTLPEPRDGFPGDVLPRWANRNWPRLLGRSYPYIWLAVNVNVYAPQPAAITPTEAAPLLSWDNGLALLNHHLPPTAAPGQVWWPTFDWQLPAGDPGDYTISLRLHDSTGELWLQSDQPLWPPAWDSTAPPPAASAAATPAASAAAAPAASAAAALRRDFPIELPAGLPPGPYQLRLRLLDQNGQPIAHTGGQPDSQLLQSLTIYSTTAPAAITRLPDGTIPLSARFGRDLELIAYQLPAGTYRPGHLLLFDLYWRTRRPPSADYQLQLQLRDAAGQVSGQNLIPLTRADYPPTQWQPGELLRSPAYIVIPANAQAGSYTIHVSLVQPDSQQPLSVRTGRQWWGQDSLALGQATIDAPPIETNFPPIETPLRADFGADFGTPAAIELHGYHLEGTIQPGQPLTVTLYWRAAATTDINYVVFVHLADDANDLIGQGDGQPGQGFRPTNSWRTGEAIIDQHTFTIRPDAPPGSYQLWIGLYHPETAERLPVFLNTTPQPDNRLLLQDVSIPSGP